MRDLPLLRRFPALARLPRVTLGSFPTPVQPIELPGGPPLLVKRDDRSGTPIGGNKVRALEWLLAGLRPGERIVTVGPRGSNHALTTATYGRLLGGHVTVVRWNQEMNETARRVDAQLRESARLIDVGSVTGVAGVAGVAGVPAAYAVAALLRLRGARWIPAGAATPRAVLGHVNAALELAEQVAAGECEYPERLVVPLGTGGTAAGLALGLRIADLRTQVVAVRVVPRVVGRAGRIVSLANATASLIAHLTGQRIPHLDSADVTVEHGFFGGAYGRPLGRDLEAEAALASIGVRLDDTYSRKALAAALVLRDRPTLFWLTFGAF